LEETEKLLESISDPALHLGQNMNPEILERNTGIPQTTEI